MEYKGYTGVIEVDEASNVLHGRVVGLRDVITFQGETVAEARQAFEDSVDDYLEFCAARGEAPEKPYSGKFVVRLEPATHRKLAAQAEAQGTSINALVVEALGCALYPGGNVKVHEPGEATGVKQLSEPSSGSYSERGPTAGSTKKRPQARRAGKKTPRRKA